MALRHPPFEDDARGRTNAMVTKKRDGVDAKISPKGNIGKNHDIVA